MASEPDENGLDKTQSFRILTNGTVISHYKIINKIGSGGMGVVYKAQDTKLGRTVALKFLPSHLLCDVEAKTRFEHEAKAASALNHTNIATIYDIDEVEDQCFMSMEYIEGKSLKELIRERTLSVKEALDIALQMAEGLNAAHKKDIIHRDIKSDNIMLTAEGVVKIMDFGLAKLKGVTKLTKTGTTLGTIHYMSPEQAQGMEVDQRSDIFSFGVVLYEMITGQLPFKGEHEAAVIYSIVNETPEPLARYKANVPEVLQRIVEKAMEKNLEVRYQHVDDFRADLTKLRRELESIISKKHPSAKKLKPSIAVLPFTDLSPNKDQEYFCDGMAEEIINALAHVKDLRVVARTSAFVFKGRHEDIREIGRKLNVEILLEGSVRKAGNRLRISAQLIKVSDGYHLWSEKYDQKMEDVFATQDEISLAIVNKLKVKLLRGEKAKLTKRHTEDLEAYNLYLKGRYFWNKRTEESLKKSIEYFQQVIENDPTYALAYVGLADSYACLPSYSPFPPKEAYQKAKEVALKALEMDETLAEAHASVASIKTYSDWDWEGVEREYKRAIELNPNYATARHWYALYLMYMARFDEGIAEMKRALELDPLSLVINRNVGQVFYYARQYDQAIDALHKTIEMDPNFIYSHLSLGLVYLQKSMHEEALAEFQKEKALAGSWNLLMEGLIGGAYVKMGKRSKAQEVLDELIERSKQAYIPPSFLAEVYFALGENDQGFKRLDEAYEERDSWMTYLKIDPAYDSVRSDPRFTALLKKMGLEK